MAPARRGIVSIARDLHCRRAARSVTLPNDERACASCCLMTRRRGPVEWPRNTLRLRFVALVRAALSFESALPPPPSRWTMASNMTLRRLWHSPTLTTWGSLGVRLGGVVLVLPLVLRHFAPPEIAVWQLFASVFMLTLMFDFGMSPTLSRMLAFARGGLPLAAMGDLRSRSMDVAAAPPPLTPDAAVQLAARLFSSMRWLYPRLALVAVLLMATLGSLAIQSAVDQTTSPTLTWAAWVLVLTGAYVSFCANAYVACLQGMDNVAALRRWEMLVGLGQIGSCLVVLLAGGGLLALVATYQLWAVLNLIGLRAMAAKLHPTLAAGRAVCDAEVVRAVWPATWRSGLGVLLSQGIIQASGVVYSQLAPAAQVASYLLALRIVTTISQFSAAPFYSKLPHLATLHARGERAEELALAARGMALAQWSLVAGILVVAMGAQPVLSRIHSAIGFVSPDVWAVMGLAFFVERFGAMHLQLYSLTNHIVWHIANAVTGVLMISSSVLLYPMLGLIALPVGMLMAYAGFYSIYAFRKSSKLFGFSFIAFEKRVSLPSASALAIVLIAVWITSR